MTYTDGQYTIIVTTLYLGDLFRYLLSPYSCIIGVNKWIFSLDVINFILKKEQTKIGIWLHGYNYIVTKLRYLISSQTY